MTDRHAVNTITSNALDELYARIATLEHVAAGNKRHVQLIVPDLERAEAALTRVRETADLWRNRLLSSQALDLLNELTAALDEPTPGPPAWTPPHPATGPTATQATDNQTTEQP